MSDHQKVPVEIRQEDYNDILDTVMAYTEAIKSQEEEHFRNLWVQDENVTMISITRCYIGIDSICRDFLIGGIQAAYSQIRLIADTTPEIHLLTQDTAVVIFSYHTECIRRESGEAYGISGIETQVMKKDANGWKLFHIHYSK